ncbi:MAG: hypothetical protein Q4A67_06215 [Aerococcus sp.]|nr:hypothetical protein [Aerococcus sp.]
MLYSKLPSSLIEEFNPGILYGLVALISFTLLFHNFWLAIPFAILLYQSFSE